MYFQISGSKTFTIQEVVIIYVSTITFTPKYTFIMSHIEQDK